MLSRVFLDNLFNRFLSNDAEGIGDGELTLELVPSALFLMKNGKSPFRNGMSIHLYKKL